MRRFRFQSEASEEIVIFVSFNFISCKFYFLCCCFFIIPYLTPTLYEVNLKSADSKS